MPMMMKNCSYPGPDAPAGAPCAHAGEINTIVSNAVSAKRGSIASGTRRSSDFPGFSACLAKRDYGIGKLPLCNRVAQLAHERLVVVQVVQGIEPRAEDLVHPLQVMQVAAREMGAGVAGAGAVQRPRVVAVAGVADLDVAVAGEEPAVAGVSRGKDAVEHVDSGRDRLDDVLGRAYAHEIARLVRGEPRRGVGPDPEHFSLGLAYRKPADRITVESDAREPREGFVAQVFDHPALDDAEQGVRVAFVRALGALSPAQGEAHRLLGVALARGIRRAFVEHHGDVRVQHPLDAHRLLGGEQQPVPVYRRGKAHAFFRDLAKLAEAEYLIAARVGQEGPRPADEAVQPAVRRDGLEPGA